MAWRPEVVAFANLMEQRLRANDHKPGWKNESPNWLVQQADNRITNLLISVTWSRLDTEVIAREAASVANFAMMAADVCGALSITEDRSKNPELELLATLINDMMLGLIQYHNDLNWTPEPDSILRRQDMIMKLVKRAQAVLASAEQGA